MPHGLTFDLMLMGRIAIGAVLGYLIGLEREYRGSPAGERTFALVALGAATFTVVGTENFPASAEKVLAGIVTGIGFLGAGMIMKESGGGLHGLTTAASMWATAGLGILAGVGEWLVALVVTGLMLLILEIESVPGLRRLTIQDRKHVGEHEKQTHSDTDDSQKGV